MLHVKNEEQQAILIEEIEFTTFQKSNTYLDRNQM
jgi:hypothetical protein